MGFRDRFYTPKTAKAILSPRILAGLAVGVALALAGLPLGAAIAVGTVVYVGSVAAAMPPPTKRASIDPFVLSEPWRQLIQSAQGSGLKLRQAVELMTVEIARGVSAIRARALVSHGAHPGLIAVPLGLARDSGGRWARTRGSNPGPLVDASRDPLAGNLLMQGTKVRVNKLMDGASHA